MDISCAALSKRYGKKIVLRSLTHTFTGGKVHAIQGDNGTGKSTLSSIICGALEADSGLVLCDGKAVCFSCTKDAAKKGIVCVEQTPPIAPSLTAMQNITLSPLPSRALRQKARQIMDRWCPNKTVPFLQKAGKDMTGAERFYTALAAALLKKPKVLCLDEPTALMEKGEALHLFALLKEEAKGGMNVIVITHHANEVELCDDVFVMGRAAECATPKEGIAFLPYSDKVELEVIENAAAWRNMGAAIIPTDKVYLASHPRLTVEQMLCAEHKGAVNTQFAQSLIDSAGVNTRPKALVSSLSGGMLQALILERELCKKPSIVFAFNPLSGLSARRAKETMQTLEDMARDAKVFVWQAYSDDSLHTPHNGNHNSGKEGGA